MQKLNVPKHILWLFLVGLLFIGVMTILRWAFVFAFHLPVPFKELIPSFVLGVRYDLRIVSIFILILFFLGIIPPLHPFNKYAGKKLAFILIAFFSFLLIFFYILDFSFYAYLSQRLSGSILNYAEDTSISMKMVWQTYPVIWLSLAIILATVVLVFFIGRMHIYVTKRSGNLGKQKRMGWGIFFFLLLAISIFGRVGQYPLRWSDAFSLGNDYKSQVALNPFQSFFSSLSYRKDSYDLEKVRKHYNLIADFLSISHPDNSNLTFERKVSGAIAPGRKPPNVVLVICESFSAFKSSMVNNPLNTTPYFNQLVQNGIYFDRCFSPAYGTAKGVWAIITGTPEVQLNSTASRNPAAVDQHTIINDFKGYEKYYFLGGSTSWANIRGLLTNNIENLHLYEEGDYKAAKIDVWGISDKNLFLEANKVLAMESKPFFAIIQTADNHRPYTIPEEDRNSFLLRRYPADTLNKYGFASNEELNAFRYTDYTFEQFFKASSKERYFDNTIFVFIGDHGIYGVAGDMLPSAFSEMRLTSEHIPLLMFAPKLLPPARYLFPVSQIDVLPTIAGLAKISYTNTTLGRDILDTNTQKKNGVYIIDIDNKNHGFIQNNIFWSENMVSQREKWGNLTNNNPVKATDTLRNGFAQMTEAFYETSRYLILNNKKKRKV